MGILRGGKQATDGCLSIQIGALSNMASVSQSRSSLPADVMSFPRGLCTYRLLHPLLPAQVYVGLACINLKHILVWGEKCSKIRGHLDTCPYKANCVYSLRRAFKTRRQSSIPTFHPLSSCANFFAFLSATPQKKRAATTLKSPLRPAVWIPSQSPSTSEYAICCKLDMRHSGCSSFHQSI